MYKSFMQNVFKKDIYRNKKKQSNRSTDTTKKRCFFTAKRGSLSRIGPHKKETIDIVVGSLLGDGWGEKRNNTTRFHIHIQAEKIEYLEYLHTILVKNGCCSTQRPNKEGAIRKEWEDLLLYKDKNIFLCLIQRYI